MQIHSCEKNLSLAWYAASFEKKYNGPVNFRKSYKLFEQLKLNKNQTHDCEQIGKLIINDFD